MAKRQLPLFILDTNRTHKLGECDYMVCTDQEAGFVARLDFVSSTKEEVGKDYRIGYSNNGISLRIQIIRYLTDNPDMRKVGTLLKAGHKLYAEQRQKNINVSNPSVDDCITFLDALAHANKKNINEAGADYNERKIVMTSISMLEHTIEYLKQLKD